MKTEVNIFSVTRKKTISPRFNGVLENVLVCAQFYSKQANVT